MYEQLAKSIGEKVSLTTEEFELCKTFFIQNYVKNKPLLEGDICSYNALFEKEFCVLTLLTIKAMSTRCNLLLKAGG
jgi:hypothetical protein